MRNSNKYALIYALFSASIGVLAGAFLGFYNENAYGNSPFYIVLAWAFGGFASGYIVWRIVGAESKTAAFFCGFITGWLTQCLSPLLFFVVSALNGPADFFAASWLIAVAVYIGVIMLSWFVVPLSIAAAFYLRFTTTKKRIGGRK
ncbi:MAG: transmembrane 9 family protein [Helicobacteraceae bacterium]|jgi:hypothetical protein|nr:transmembrane 9 family protein [Helicobacteraceae bacterium]